MTEPAKSIRFPGAIRALIEAKCAATGASFSDVVVDACAAQLGGHDLGGAAAPLPPTPAAPRLSATVMAPKADRAKAALASAEARQGVTRARLDTSMVPVHDGGKRPAYQKRQAGQEKAGRDGRGR